MPFTSNADRSLALIGPYRLILAILGLVLSVFLGFAIDSSSRATLIPSRVSTHTQLTIPTSPGVGVSSIAADAMRSERGATSRFDLKAHAGSHLSTRQDSLAVSPYLSASTPSTAAAPLLITESDSTRAIALESTTWNGEPFVPTTLTSLSLSADRQTRISLFAMNVGPSFGDPDASSITANAEDFAHKRYPLLVEYVGDVPGYPWLKMVIVRLNETLGLVGDVLISVHAHGETSNRVRVGIGFVGSGLPDDSLPTPVPTGSLVASSTPTQTTRYANGYVRTDGNYYQGRATVTLSLSDQLQSVVAESGGYFEFTEAPIGAVLTAIASGYSFGSLIVDDASPYFIIDGVSVPTATPTPEMTPPVISEVSSSGVTASAAAISWTTNEASDTQVEYGTTTSYGSSSALNTSMVTSHSASLGGLSVSTLYHYRVKSRDAAGNLATSADSTFTTSAGSSSGCPGFTIEGFGSNTTGGCGGTIYTVTNLNDSGPGSLRDVINRAGPRIIRFAVSGTITLQTYIEVTQPSLTIDGSTAPNGGIAVNGMVVLTTTNVIVRYIRFRHNTTGEDCLQIHNSSNVVIDHCSLSWAKDENLDLASQNVTIQWSILSENMGTGALLMNYGTNPTTTLHHNLFADNWNNARLPEMGVGSADIVNNVFYNYFNYGNTRFAPGCNACGGGGPIHVNVVGNYYKPGPQSAVPPLYSREIRLDGRDPVLAGQSSIYIHGNIGPNRPNDNLPDMDMVWLDSGGFATLGSRLNFPAVVTTSANQAYADVLANAGARLPCLDAVDQRVINDVVNRTGNTGGKPSWPDLTQPCQ